MPKSEGTYNSFLIDFLIAPKYRFGEAFAAGTVLYFCGVQYALSDLRRFSG